MFVAAIVAGATSLGVDVHVVGVVPTPALAFLARTGPYRAGIMVSASHNPAEDNGLKVLDRDGLKLDDDIEDELEDLIWREAELGGVGNASSAGGSSGDALERYLDHRRGLAARSMRRAAHRARRGERLGARPGRGSSRRRAPGWTRSTSTRRGQHQRRCGRDRAAALARQSSRAAPTSGSRSTATPTG
jgi:phosphomannomutase